MQGAGDGTFLPPCHVEGRRRAREPRRRPISLEEAQSLEVALLTLDPDSGMRRIGRQQASG